MKRHHLKGGVIAGITLAALATAFQNCGRFDLTIPAAELMVDQSSNPSGADAFEQQPASKVVALGGTLSLAASLKKSSDAMSYQWYFRRLSTSDFVVLAGQTSQELRIESFDGNRQGDYRVTVQTEAGLVQSQIASVSMQSLNNTCLVSDLAGLPLPLAGEDGKEWSLASYVDLNPASGQSLDYHDGSRTFDGSNGTLFALANFRVMDAGVSVFSVTDGVVESVMTTQDDRNTDFSHPEENYVRVRVANGYSVTYGHLKKGASLKVGDVVTKGQLIGQVGASGLAAGPQLRLEIRDCAGLVVDPLKTGSFAMPPVYMAAPSYMGSSASASNFSFVADAKKLEATPLDSSRVGDTVYLVDFVAHMSGGDKVSVEFRNPVGQLVSTAEYSLPGMSYLGIYYSMNGFAFNAPGAWKISVLVNGKLLNERAWNVTAAAQ